LLLDDWTTWHDGKQAVLADIQYPFIGSGSSPAPAPTNTPTKAPVQPTNTPTKAPVLPTSTPTQAPVQPTSAPTQAPGSTLVLADFENRKVNFNVFNDWNSSISRKVVKPGMVDKYSLEVQYKVAEHGWAGVDLSYDRAQDWTAYTHLNFVFRGTASRNDIRVEILDNRAANSNWDTAERFEYIFKDDFTGWRQFKIPFSSFARRGDWQPEGAPNDGFNRTVWGFNLSPLHGWGSFRVDQFELSR
jgi:hypothetical protein